jgi:hypothetical protein
MHIKHKEIGNCTVSGAMSGDQAGENDKVRFGSVLSLFVALGAVMSVSFGHAETLHSTNFKFGKGSPFGGLVTLGDIRVLLVTSNTEPWGETAIRDQLTGVPAIILFCFSRPVDEFRISFSRLFAGEILSHFTAGTPTRIEGDLILRGVQEYTVPRKVGDHGKGTLIWDGLNASVFGFVIDNRRGWATAVDRFALSGGNWENNVTPNAGQKPKLGFDDCDFEEDDTENR